MTTMEGPAGSEASREAEAPRPDGGGREQTDDGASDPTETQIFVETPDAERAANPEAEGEAPTTTTGTATATGYGDGDGDGEGSAGGESASVVVVGESSSSSSSEGERSEEAGSSPSTTNNGKFVVVEGGAAAAPVVVPGVATATSTSTRLDGGDGAAAPPRTPTRGGSGDRRGVVQVQSPSAADGDAPEVATGTGTPQQNNRPFFKRLNNWRTNSRQVISARATDVLVAATPVVQKAGQAAQEAGRAVQEARRGRNGPGGGTPSRGGGGTPQQKRSSRTGGGGDSVGGGCDDASSAASSSASSSFIKVSGGAPHDEDENSGGAAVANVEVDDGNDRRHMKENGATSKPPAPTTLAPLLSASRSSHSSHSSAAMAAAAAAASSTAEQIAGMSFRGRYTSTPTGSERGDDDDSAAAAGGGGGQSRPTHLRHRSQSSLGSSTSQLPPRHHHPRIGAAGATSVGSAILQRVGAGGGGGSATGSGTGSAASGPAEAAQNLLNSAAGRYAQKLLANLSNEHQYVLLLGMGLMGVNLKDRHAYAGGVYVDWIAPGGNAERSGVVGVGDVLVRVGDVDVAGGSIAEVPDIIARASRPVPIILTREHLATRRPLDLLDGDGDEDGDGDGDGDGDCGGGEEGSLPPPTALERAVAAVLDIQRRAMEGGGVASMPLVAASGSGGSARGQARHDDDDDLSSVSSSSSSSSSSDDSSLLVGTNRPPRPPQPPTAGRHAKQQQQRVPAPSYQRQNSNSETLPAPSTRVQKSLRAYASQKTSEMSSFAALRRAASSDPDFRDVIRSAFVECCTDPRCLPFVAAHVSRQDKLDLDSAAGASGAGNGGRASPSPAPQQPPPQPPASVKLMMWLEIRSYVELWGVTPESRRPGGMGRGVDHARRVARKFLLASPSPSPGGAGDEGEGGAPMFDLRGAVPGEVVDALRSDLRLDLERRASEDHDDERRDPDDDAPFAAPRDVFDDVRECLEGSLCGGHFASFVLSDNCARMRAYLSGSPPLLHTGAGSGWEDILHSALPPLPGGIRGGSGVGGGEGGDDDDEDDDDGGCLHRASDNSDDDARNLLHCVMLHASSQGENGVGCGVGAAVYLRRTLLPLLEGAAATADDGATRDDLVLTTLERFWEAYLSPDVGHLDSVAHTAECQGALRDARRALVEAVAAAAGPSPSGDGDGGEGDLERIRLALVKLDVRDSLRRLCEELTFDYAVNMHSKFRSSDLYERLCGEVHEHNCRRRTSSVGGRPGVVNFLGSSDDGRDITIPRLPDGCIPRLLRKTTLPESVSIHRPEVVPPTGGASGTSPAKEPTSDDDNTDEGSSAAVPQDVAAAKTEAEGVRGNARFAVVFGTDNDNDGGSSPSGHGSSAGERASSLSVRRFATIPLCGTAADDGQLTASDIPSTLESYAAVPPSRARPFGDAAARSTGRDDDGWEASLVNFSVPNATQDDPHGCVYGVALVLNQRQQSRYGGSGAGTCEADRDGDGGGGGNNDAGPSTPPRRPSDGADETDVTGRGGGPSNGAAPVVDDASAVPQDAGEPAAPPERGAGVAADAAGDGSDARGDEETTTTSGNIVDTVNRIFDEAPTPLRLRRLREGPGTGTSAAAGRNNQDKAGNDNNKTIGIALVSHRNVIPAMRCTLSNFYADFSSAVNSCDDDGCGGDEGSSSDVTSSAPPPTRMVNGLADLLGNFSDIQVGDRTLDLAGVLRPYLESGSSPWTTNGEDGDPIGDQVAAFEHDSVEQLLRSLQPIPFVLVLVTALLEQKIVFSSSRRSILLSAVSAVNALLRPLRWPHLVVPLVPAGVAGDLVHYPAPFMIGIPSDDGVGQDIVNSLPDDITLVDLDAGRVILASEYAVAADERAEEESSRRDLRIQVLYLAEELGALLASRLCPRVWHCDSPFQLMGALPQSSPPSSDDEGIVDVYQTVKCLCNDFVGELLAGANSCCTWIEEAHHDGGDGASEVTVLFDEDRFFHLKNLRTRGRCAPLIPPRVQPEHQTSSSSLQFALSLDEFDLFLETFLRGQAMSTFISSQPKESMMYW